MIACILNTHRIRSNGVVEELDKEPNISKQIRMKKIKVMI